MSSDISNMHRLGIDAWSVEDRLRLIGEIWESLDHAADVPESHREELDRRLARADADPTAGSSGEEVLARLRARQ
jgi:putative addiction module component (TIGR02574 family)